MRIYWFADHVIVQLERAAWQHAGRFAYTYVPVRAINYSTIATLSKLN
jgi:hypothetical protein